MATHERMVRSSRHRSQRGRLHVLLARAMRPAWSGSGGVGALGSAQRSLSAYAVICQVFNSQPSLIRRPALRRCRAETRQTWAA